MPCHPRRLRPVVAGASLLFALLASPIAVAEQASATLTINLRAEPDLSSRITGVLKPGEAVELLETYGEFVRVRRASGTTGHLKRKYLQPLAVAAAEASVPVASADAAPAANTPPSVPPVAESAPATPPPPAAVATQAPATASPAPVRAPDAPHVYVRAMAGVGFESRTPSGIERALDTAGGTVALRKLDTAVPAFELAVGYAVTSHWALELGVMQSGDFGGRVEAVDADPQRLEAVLEDTYPRGGWGGKALAVAQRGIGAWQLGAGGGAFCAFEDAAVDTGALGVSLGSPPCAPLVSLRVGHALNANWTLGLAANAVFFENRVINVGLTLQYH